MELVKPHLYIFPSSLRRTLGRLLLLVAWLFACIAHGEAQTPVSHPLRHANNAAATPDSAAVASVPTLAVAETPDSLAEAVRAPAAERAVEDLTPGELLSETEQQLADSLTAALNDSIAREILAQKKRFDEWEPREVEFVPNPTKACWMSALFPGLGQVYNRRYWKLPIIVGGYLGLAYATDWNNTMLKDYTTAYADLLDNDPDTKSYMDMFSPNVKEESLDKQWLQNVLRSKKNYFRRNRDLCVICMVAVYFLAMVDAYVDASLSHFDITPELSMDVAPTLMRDSFSRGPSIGLAWAVNF